MIVFSIIFTKGTPDKEEWKNLNLLPAFIEFEHRDPIDLSDLLKFHQNEAKELLYQMLAFDPLQRIKPSTALSHSYFLCGNEATPPESLPPERIKSNDDNEVNKRMKI